MQNKLFIKRNTEIISKFYFYELIKIFYFYTNELSKPFFLIEKIRILQYKFVGSPKIKYLSPRVVIL